MQLLPLTPEQIHLGLRAMKTVAVANQSFSDEERILLESVAETLGVETSVDALVPVTPDAVAAALPDVDERRHVVQMLIFTAMIDGDAGADEMGVIDTFARELCVEREFVEEVYALAIRELTTMRLDVVRRIPYPARVVGREGDGEAHGGGGAAHESGWRGLWKIFRNVSESNEDMDLAWRHKKLGLLPPGTLGREYWAHMTERRFLFPGERGAVVPAAGLHDFLHVLCGYDTDAAGETEVTAFIAGMKKIEDPFALLFGSLCMYHLGEKLMPGVTPAAHKLEPGRVGRAFRRGLLTEVDFYADWDPWGDVERNVVELQKQYNIYAG